MVNLVDRFLSKVSPEPNSGCWLWMGSGHGRGGYGSFKMSAANGNMLAHRAAFALLRGPIPQGMMVCHKCDVRCCVNPDHLFLGTAADNARDRDAKGRAAEPPHPAGADHPRFKHGRFAAPRGRLD